MSQPAPQRRPTSCQVSECDEPTEALICHVHLPMLPPPLRQTIGDNPTLDTCPAAILTAALEHIAHRQSRAATRSPRRRRKPVQLALFDI
ncbi:hypothetical protein [Mycolicibacterium fortuitum]|uniref:hypothetical protein n=2 Tax=Mycolicibacterium fortuitum TaxID=1766 RepID=UPI000ACCE47C|nr:hypothetical protein [Mycolicibacterium fortuitum]MDG5769404.1 hypothetical protein [Mycolicibacterium fortuitum]MDV7195805.1 hypothetical protein [Mycolicibacterium fortuitum]NOQ62676.1 hypothetical protein [Mycolicibacterium fortuitum]